MAHRLSFTLYPLGHVPYGRVAVAPVTIDGEPLRDRDGDHGSFAWDITIFRAVSDAARTLAWPRVLASDDAERGQESWRTQRRRLVLAASLLGVCAEPLRMQPAVAAELGIPTLVVRDAARAFATPGWRRYAARGRAIEPMLDRVAPDCMLERLLTAGTLVQAWGPAYRWDVEHGVLRTRGPPR